MTVSRRLARLSPLVAVAVLALAACGPQPFEGGVPASWSADVAAAPEARLAAVMVHADWCGACKTLDPRIGAAQAAAPIAGAVFVKLDYTAKDKDAFFADADARGVGKAVREALSRGVSTGQLLLVDLDDQTVLGVVKGSPAPAEIAATITEAAGRA